MGRAKQHVGIKSGQGSIAKRCPFCGSDNIKQAKSLDDKAAKIVTCIDCGAVVPKLAIWQSRPLEDIYITKAAQYANIIKEMRSCENCYRKTTGSCSTKIKSECKRSNSLRNWTAPCSFRKNPTGPLRAIKDIEGVRDLYDKLELMQNCLNCANFCNEHSANNCGHCKYYASNYGIKNMKNNWRFRMISIYEEKLRRDKFLDIPEPELDLDI